MVNFKSLFEKTRYGGTKEAEQEYRKYAGFFGDAFRSEQQGFMQGYGSYRNPYVGQFLSPYEGMESEIDRLPGLIERSALASTDPASSAAAVAARTAAGGRGGLAYAGGAGELAARGAAGAATQQSAALAQALMQGQSITTEMKMGLADRRASGIQAQAGFEDARFARLFEQDARFRELFLSEMGILGRTALSSGMAGQSAANAQRGGLLGAAGGAVAGIAGAAAMCWVAREVYGINNPRWIVFKYYLLLKAPKLLRNLYLKKGEAFAKWIKNKKWLRKIIRSLMDRKVEGVLNGY